jgi:uncharacterized protein (DUF1810 family)
MLRDFISPTRSRMLKWKIIRILENPKSSPFLKDYSISWINLVDAYRLVWQLVGRRVEPRIFSLCLDTDNWKYIMHFCLRPSSSLQPPRSNPM